MSPNLVSIAALLLILSVNLIDDRVEASIIKNKIEEYRQNHRHKILHNHMSKKIFDRACAASKDVIEEVILCVTDNKDLLAHFQMDAASNCYKTTYGTDFDRKDLMKHHEEICKQREKFEDLIGCVYHQMTANATAKVMDEISNSLVDVGLCIINALDG